MVFHIKHDNFVIFIYLNVIPFKIIKHLKFYSSLFAITFTLKTETSVKGNGYQISLNKPNLINPLDPPFSTQNTID